MINDVNVRKFKAINTLEDWSHLSKCYRFPCKTSVIERPPIECRKSIEGKVILLNYALWLARLKNLAQPHHFLYKSDTVYTLCIIQVINPPAYKPTQLQAGS